MLSPNLPNRKLCAISPTFCPFIRIIPKSPVSFGMCWKLSASKRGKTTESKNTHKPHKTTITKAGPGSAIPDGKAGEQNPSKVTSKVSHRQLRKIRGFQVIQKHQFEEKCATHFSNCSVPDCRALLGFRDPGEAAAANFPSATLNLKETPKKPLAKESLGKKKSSYSPPGHLEKDTTVHKVSMSKHDCHSTNWAIKTIFIANTSVRYHNLFKKPTNNPSRIFSHFWQVAECLYLC